MIYAVIMAGGSGTRFWPKSTQALPKQFLNLFGSKTMIQETVARLDGYINPDRVMVVTNADYVPIVNRQLPETLPGDVIGEPVAKNTAPCVAAAAALLHKKDPDSVMVVLPADHHITQPEAFLTILKSAVETAQTEKSLVTIGIEPNRPETGYGYIRFDDASVISKNGERVYRVKNFTEKPDEQTAKQFLSSGEYLWNSGMFIWKTSSILEAFKEHLPQIYTEAEKLLQSEGTPEDVDAFYNACPSISIDYGIMERAGAVHVVPGNFGWNDVGSWTAVHELADKDDNGNANGNAKVSIHESTSNLVQSESGKVIALVGVDNIGLIETDKAILVVNLDKAQGVKAIVEDLKKDPGKSRYL